MCELVKMGNIAHPTLSHPIVGAKRRQASLTLADGRMGNVAHTPVLAEVFDV